MMLLIGMWISLTKKPMKPMIAKPMAVAIAIFWNSFLSGLVHRFTRRIESLVNFLTGSVNSRTCSILNWRWVDWSGLIRPKFAFYTVAGEQVCLIFAFGRPESLCTYRLKSDLLVELRFWNCRTRFERRWERSTCSFGLKAIVDDAD